ncbi:MAG: zinc metalloprotease HtpX [Thermoprotei archaeon]
MFWLWFYDPLTMFALIIAYAVGYIAMLLLASLVAPRIANKLSNKFSLYTSMGLAMGIIILAGFSGIYLIALLLVNLAGFPITFLFGLVLFLVIVNILTYFLSPLMINAFYGAKPSSELQEIVNSIAKRAGFKKPPRAVVVNGPPNAFAYGNFLTGRYVAVTTGMLSLVNRSELESVIGHELGHHKHRDTVIMLLLGLFPSILYYLGIMTIRLGLLGGFTSSSRERRGGNGGLILLLIGIGAIILSFILQILILAFSRLREYYADAHGALVTSPRSMQRALAKLHIYYKRHEYGREWISTSKLKTLFIYALVNSVANPLVNVYPSYYGDPSEGDVDKIVERVRREKVNPVVEVLSSHPPIPKRIRFLDQLPYSDIRA